MSSSTTFESSSSFVAPAAAAATRSNSTTRAAGLRRKTYNHRALTINTSPTLRTKPYFVDTTAYGAAVDSDEEEERIRANLIMPVVVEEEHQRYSWESDGEYNHHHDTAAVNISIQLGIVDAVRDTFRRAKKMISSSSSSQIIPAITLLAIFFMLVVFGGSVSTSSSSSSYSHSTSSLARGPSGHSMRIPLWAPSHDQDKDTPPATARRVARAASFTTMKNTPAPSPAAVVSSGEGHQPRQPVPLSPSPFANDDTEAERAPSGTVSAKFRLLHAEEQQMRKKRQEEHEHDHPDDLAALFNGGKHV